MTVNEVWNFFGGDDKNVPKLDCGDGCIIM